MIVIKLVIAFIFFFGGLALMGYASQVSSWQALMFFSGIISIVLAYALPMHVFNKTS
jgi:hypothetical protein